MGNKIRADVCAERKIEPQFQREGAHPSLSDRRNGLAREIYKGLAAGDRFSSRSILGDAQFCLIATLSHGGSSPYRMAFGSNPVDLFLGQDGDSDSQIAHDTSVNGAMVTAIRRMVTAMEAAGSGAGSHTAGDRELQTEARVGA